MIKKIMKIFGETNLKVPSLSDFKTFLFENDFKTIIPESFLVVISLLLLIFGVVLSTSKQYSGYSFQISKIIHWLGGLTLLWTALLLARSPINGTILFNISKIDEWATFFKFLVIFGAFFSVLISIEYMKKESLTSFEYVIFLLLSTASMLFLISSTDFLSMYLAIELQTLCFYVMAAWKRNSEFSTEAGLKYYLLGAFSSGIILWGCSLIYGSTGLTSFSELAKLLSCDGGTTIERLGSFSLRPCELGMIFILVGFLFKLTAAPFHMWAPDVYEGAPTPVSAFFAITPKISVLSVFTRLFVETFHDLLTSWQIISIFTSLLSMIFGSIAALSQKKIKRILAFSSINHVGFILVGISSASDEGTQALLVYLVIYIIMAINLFTIVICATREDVHEMERLKHITDLALLSKSQPVLAFSIGMSMFSLAGIPPLVGFYGKACLLFAAISSSQYLLAGGCLVATVLSCFYYIRLIKVMYFELPSSWCSASTVARENSLMISSTLLLIMFLIIFAFLLYLIACLVSNNIFK